MARRSHLVDGPKVVRLRTARAWTQEQLKEKAGLHITTVNDVESGKKRFDLSTIGSLAKALEVAPIELILVDEPAATEAEPSPQREGGGPEEPAKEGGAKPVVQRIQDDGSEESRRDLVDNQVPTARARVEFGGCFVGGSIGGSVAGLYTAIDYYRHYPASDRLRLILIVLYGFLIGSGCGATVEYLLPIQRLPRMPPNRWIRAVVLCAFVGAPVGFGGAIFVPHGGRVDPVQLTVAWLLGTACIAPVAIAREDSSWRSLWRAFIGSTFSSAIHCFVFGTIVAQNRAVISHWFVGGSPNPALGGAVLGIAIGAFMGSQIWLALLLGRRSQLP